MLALIVQVITFLLALIGTFFKCVKEDSRGNPLHSSRGLPVLTTPGRYILTLLVGSFLLSLLLTWKSSQQMDGLTGDVAVARRDLTKALKAQLNLSLQLNGAKDEIQGRQEADQKESVGRLSDVARKLEGTSNLLERKTRDLSPVKSFSLILFFDGMNRPVRIGDRGGMSAGEDRGLVPGDSPGLLKDMLCGSQVDFDIQISSNPTLEFSAICVGHDFIPVVEVPGSKYSAGQILLDVRYEHWEPSRRGMFVLFSVNEKQVTQFTDSKVADDSGSFSALRNINMNSFAPDHGAFASFSTHGSGGKHDFDLLEPFLPKYVGFSIAPNHGALDPQSTWVYGARQRASSTPAVTFVFRDRAKIRIRSEWRIFSDYSLPTDFPSIFMNTPAKPEQNPF
jgi:hypothetical protein